MKALLLAAIIGTAATASAEDRSTLIRFGEVIRRRPDIQDANVKVWTIRKTETIRVNLVEMSGELGLHKHPDAAHSLMLLQGSVKVQMDGELQVLEEGDFVSIPAGTAHKYWSLTPKSLLISMDAPYYKTTIPLE